MRYALLAALLLMACRGAPSPGHDGSAGSRAGTPSGLSDDELVAFVRWQREYAEVTSRHRAELNALASDDPSKPMDEAVKEAGRAAAEVFARQAPVMKSLMDRFPLKGAKVDLAYEATGGLFHVETTPTGAQIVIARDEERSGAARRKFGDKAVDDVLARESLILAELRRP